MKLSEAIWDFETGMKGVKSSYTIRWYHHKLASLSEYLKDPDLQDITIWQLRNWRGELMERKTLYDHHPSKTPTPGHLSVCTVAGFVRAIRHFFVWCVEEKLLDINPAVRLERPRIPKTRKHGLNASDRNTLLAAAEDNPRDYAILRVLADTGCRVGGVASMLLSELDLEAGFAIVHEKGRGGTKDRPIFFDGETIMAIRLYLRDRPDWLENDHVFVGLKRGGTHPGWHELTESGVYQIIKRLAKSCGLGKGWNPHNWRHGAARGMIARGMPLPIVSQILGHSSIQVTADYYGAFSDSYLKLMHDQYTWLGNRSMPLPGQETLRFVDRTKQGGIRVATPLSPQLEKKSRPVKHGFARDYYPRVDHGHICIEVCKCGEKFVGMDDHDEELAWDEAFCALAWHLHHVGRPVEWLKAQGFYDRKISDPICKGVI